MSCHLIIFDYNLKPLDDEDIVGIATTEKWVPIRTAHNGPGGIHLKFPKGHLVYRVTIDDESERYAPEPLGTLNGAFEERLHPVLFRIPLRAGDQSPGGGNPMASEQNSSNTKGGAMLAPRTFAEIASFINSQRSWSDEEKEGVRRLIRAIIARRNTRDSEMLTRVYKWEERLRRLNIDPELLRKEEYRSVEEAVPARRESLALSEEKQRKHKKKKKKGEMAEWQAILERRTIAERRASPEQRAITERRAITAQRALAEQRALEERRAMAERRGREERRARAARAAAEEAEERRTSEERAREQREREEREREASASYY